MIDIIDNTNNSLESLSILNSNFIEYQNSSSYSMDFNNISLNDRDFKAISENIRLLKLKRFREKGFQKRPNIDFGIIENALFYIFYPEFKTILELIDNRENNLSMDNEMDDVYFIQTVNTPKEIELKGQNKFNSINTVTANAFYNEKEISENSDELNRTSRKYFTVKILNERGRKRINIKDGKNKQKKHRKTDLDNILTKVQVNFIKFIVNLANDILKKVNEQNKKFLDIKYDIKKKINFKNFENLKTLKIKDILQLPASKKFRNVIEKEEHNKRIFHMMKNTSECLNEFFNMNYISLFKSYFNDCEPLKTINIKGKEFDLSNNTKSFYYLVKKNNFNEIERNLFIKSTKTAYFCDVNNKTPKKSFLVKKGK